MQPLATRRAVTIRALAEFLLALGYFLLGRHFGTEGFRGDDVSASLNAALVFHALSVLVLVCFAAVEVARGGAVLVLEWRERVVLDRLAGRIHSVMGSHAAESHAIFEAKPAGLGSFAHLGGFSFDVGAPTPPARGARAPPGSNSSPPAQESFRFG